MKYGVLVDMDFPREDGGVPVYWDGWYDDENLARQALAIMGEKYPGFEPVLVVRHIP